MTEDDTSAAEPLHLEVRRGHASPEDVAAVIAVVGESLAREAATAIADEPAVSAWAISARGVRSGHRRDVPWGRWAG